jgi:hypothetical protein
MRQTGEAVSDVAVPSQTDLVVPGVRMAGFRGAAPSSSGSRPTAFAATP